MKISDSVTRGELTFSLKGGSHLHRNAFRTHAEQQVEGKAGPGNGLGLVWTNECERALIRANCVQEIQLFLLND